MIERATVNRGTLVVQPGVAMLWHAIGLAKVCRTAAEATVCSCGALTLIWAKQ